MNALANWLNVGLKKIQASVDFENLHKSIANAGLPTNQDELLLKQFAGLVDSKTTVGLTAIIPEDD